MCAPLAPRRSAHPNLPSAPFWPRTEPVALKEPGSTLIVQEEGSSPFSFGLAGLQFSCPLSCTLRSPPQLFTMAAQSMTLCSAVRPALAGRVGRRSFAGAPLAQQQLVSRPREARGQVSAG